MYNTKTSWGFCTIHSGSKDLNAQRKIEIIGARFISQFHFPKFYPPPPKKTPKKTHTHGLNIQCIKSEILRVIFWKYVQDIVDI